MTEAKRYCSKCGSEVMGDAEFCSRCGNRIVAVPMSSQPTRSEMPPGPRRHEKHEKDEKNEKNEKGEKGSDLEGPLVAGAVLIWLGISFYLMNTLGAIPRPNWWAYFLSGLGVILIVQGVGRSVILNRSGTGRIIGGVVVLGIGLASIVGSMSAWPIFLIAIGIVVIAGGVLGRRRVPKP